MGTRLFAAYEGNAERPTSNTERNERAVFASMLGVGRWTFGVVSVARDVQGSPVASSVRRMTISLNGESVDTRDAKTIAELVDCYELPPQSILVEHNGLAVHRHEWAERPLSEGDRVEFIRVVAGG